MVKSEERRIHFLDFRETIHEKNRDFEHEKSGKCRECDLDSICS